MAMPGVCRDLLPELDHMPVAIFGLQAGEGPVPAMSLSAKPTHGHLLARAFSMSVG